MNKKETVIVTGALGQIGTELVAALRAKYGAGQVVATDIRPVSDELLAEGPYLRLDVTDSIQVAQVMASVRPTQIYHLAAVLSASGEKNPLATWNINMVSLLDVLEAARQLDACKVFWPSSIAVFGNNAPKSFCAQHVPHQPLTVYGISKSAGELWCQYYHERYGLDVRSIRYPGLISYTAQPGGGTTDYAVAIFHEAIRAGRYTCYLEEHTQLPMLYMPDAIRATLELMEAGPQRLTVRTSYNLSGITFDPHDIAACIRQYLPEFTISYQPDVRQTIAQSWPSGIDGQQATADWSWKHAYSLQDVVADMLLNLGDEYLRAEVERLRPGLVDQPKAQEASHML